MNDTTYKKERKILRAVNRKQRILGIIYLLFGIVYSFLMINSKEPNFITGTPMLSFFYLGAFTMNSGYSTYVQAKNAAARNSFKGAVSHLDVIVGLPVKRESVVRYIAENWRISSAAILTASFGTVVVSYLFFEPVWVSTIIIAAVTMIFSATVLFENISGLCSSLKKGRLPKMIGTIVVGATLGGALVMQINLDLNDKFKHAFVNLIPHSAAVLGVIAVVYAVFAVVMELWCRKLTDKCKGMYWYE